MLTVQEQILLRERSEQSRTRKRPNRNTMICGQNQSSSFQNEILKALCRMSLSQDVPSRVLLGGIALSVCKVQLRSNNTLNCDP
eukprot:586159-Amphidinium_carterae.3